MFYSPKKDIDRYVSFKNHQIKTLKQQLQEEKITEQNIIIAKKKLQKIKNQYNVLLSENHLQLIETLQKVEGKKKSLEQDVSLKRKQLDLKTCQKNDLLQMKRQLLNKVEKAKQQLEQQSNKKAQLMIKSKQVDESVKKVISENEKTRKQNQEMSCLLNQAKKQLVDSKSKAQTSQERLQYLKEKMSKVGSFILQQKQKICSLRTLDKIQELKIQNLQTEIKYLSEVKTNLLAKKDKINANKLFAKERSELNRHQMVSSQMMNFIVNISDEINENEISEKQACQREIKETLIQLELQQGTNKQLESQLITLKQKIAKTDNKSNAIIQGLCNMQIQDSNLISMITGYNSIKKDKNADSKQVRKVFENKQNVPLMEYELKKSTWSKLSSLELAKTSDDQ